jgi:hypothetical protein
MFSLTFGLTVSAESVWIKVTENDFESIYFDSYSMVIHGPTVSVDEVINRHKTDAIFRVVSFLSRVEYDCLFEEKATIKLLTTSKFFGRGEVLSDTSKSKRWRGSGWSSIEKGNKFYNVMESLCADNLYYKREQ